MKTLLIPAVLLIGLSPLAVCCDSVLADDSAPAKKTKQHQSDTIPGGGTMCGGGKESFVTIARPVYPPAARAARIQGHVIMKAVITKKGDVDQLELVSGHPMLVDAAMEAVKKWKYKPYLVKGKPVRIKTTIDVNFSLSGG